MKKKIFAALLTSALVLGLTACGGGSSEGSSAASASSASAASASASSQAEGTVYHIGLCNYVDDASLNQIVDNITTRLEEIGAEKGVTFQVDYDNCNADANVMAQIISNFVADKADMMIAIATPVAMQMQAATEDNQIPVVFAAVSDPVSCGVVASNEAPGANITGTSDALDTSAILNLMLVQNPDLKTVGLLYDIGQDSSTSAIAEAKAFLTDKGIAFKEYTGTNVSEVTLAAQAAVADKVDAIFTPSDNTIMTAELSIYEYFAEAKIPHYAGADSFALNGAFLGYGVDYANLGVETANMAADILLNAKNPGEVPVMTFDNGTATVNTDICEQMGLDYDDLAEAFGPYCTKVQPITTAESFE